MSSINLTETGGGSNTVALKAPSSIGGSGREITFFGGGTVLESFSTPCDGSTITVPSGSYTVGNVTASQTLSTTYADANGSSISYTPPTGTKNVIYEFSFNGGRGDTYPYAHFKFYIDSDEVTNFRNTLASYIGHFGMRTLKWSINIGGSAVTATGRLASWTSAKTLKIQARDYSASYEAILFNAYEFDGSSSNQFQQPQLSITSIG